MRELILLDQPGHPDEYAVSIATYDDGITQGVVLQPTTVGRPSVQLYRFVIAGFRFLIKVDQRPMPRELLPFALHDGEQPSVNGKQRGHSSFLGTSFLRPATIPHAGLQPVRFAVVPYILVPNSRPPVACVK